MPLTAAGKVTPKARPGPKTGPRDSQAQQPTSAELEKAKAVLAKCGLKGAGEFCTWPVPWNLDSVRHTL
jgi:hypothetical protein